MMSEMDQEQRYKIIAKQDGKESAMAVVGPLDDAVLIARYCYEQGASVTVEDHAGNLITEITHGC